VTVDDLPRDAESPRIERVDRGVLVTPLGDVEHQDAVLQCAVLLRRRLPDGLRMLPGVLLGAGDLPPWAESLAALGGPCLISGAGCREGRRRQPFEVHRALERVAVITGLPPVPAARDAGASAWGDLGVGEGIWSVERREDLSIDSIRSRRTSWRTTCCCRTCSGSIPARPG